LLMAVACHKYHLLRKKEGRIWVAHANNIISFFFFKTSRMIDDCK
jgi:hypothetical protein